MARNVKIELKKGAVVELLQSAEMAADLIGRAQRIAETAGEGFEAELHPGRDRVRASVRTATPKAMEEEAIYRTLTSAIDAGR